MSISSGSVLVFVETEAVVSRVVFVATFFFFLLWREVVQVKYRLFFFNEVEVSAEGSGSGGGLALFFDAREESGTGGGWVLFFGKVLEEENDEAIDWIN